MCECSGAVIYAQDKHNKSGKILTFKQSLKENYLWNQTTKEIMCKGAKFGGDPAPGYKK